MNRPSAPKMLDDAALAKAVRALVKIEPRFGPVVARHGVPSLRSGGQGLEALLHMVTEQFLSISAAAAIWARVKAHLGDVRPAAVLACPQEALVALGLSRAKAKSFHGLAAACACGVLDFDRLQRLPDDEAHRALVALPGIGPWTADIYLLSSLLRADVWPWGDVALQVAAHDLFDLAARPGKTAMIALGEPFRPYRAAAARLLWAHYRGLKAMPQA